MLNILVFNCVFVSLFILCLHLQKRQIPSTVKICLIQQMFYIRCPTSHNPLNLSKLAQEDIGLWLHVYHLNLKLNLKKSNS